MPRLPLPRVPDMSSPSRIDTLRTQLRQIDELVQTGALSAEQGSEAKAKLERQLVEAVMALPEGGGAAAATAAPTPVAVPGATKPRTPARLVWGMVAFVAAVGAGGYALVGNPGAWSVSPAASSMGANGASPTAPAADPSGRQAPHAMGSDQISAMTESLATKLKTDPNNAEGWAMLARSYAVLGRFDEAVTAYQRVLTLRQDDAQVYADYADALAVTRGRKLEGEPAKLVEKALSLDPRNFKALSLAGTVAFNQQDFKRAADLWQRALASAPADNPTLVQQIRTDLDEARQRAGMAPLATTELPGTTTGTSNQETSASNATADASVSGTVTLAPALAGKLPPDATVFVFAKAAQGPKMPLAILRKQVKDLPLNFTLNDALAMSPQMKLSGFSDVVVGARSAVFAPLPALRLIVVDEEHEPAYKQGESPRYHGRDVAVMRAKLAGAVAVLGSATPSLESFTNVELGKYRLLQLTKRIDDRRLPCFRIGYQVADGVGGLVEKGSDCRLAGHEWLHIGFAFRGVYIRSC